MPVNFKQYRGTVGVFNNYNLLFKKTQIITKNILKVQLITIVILPVVLTIRCVISLSSADNIRFLRQSVYILSL